MGLKKFFKKAVNVLNPINTGKVILGYGLGNKYEADLNQEIAYEMADKNRATSMEMFGLQKAENLEAFERNKNLANENWEREKAYNEEMWNRANEYNSPASQMARYKEAGLNPALMYGQGNSGNTTVIKSPDLNTNTYDSAKGEVARADTPSVRSNMLSSLLDYVGLRTQLLSAENLKVQNEVLKEQKRLTEANADYTEYENEYFKSRRGVKSDWFISKFLKDATYNLADLVSWGFNLGKYKFQTPADFEGTHTWDGKTFNKK